MTISVTTNGINIHQIADSLGIPSWWSGSADVTVPGHSWLSKVVEAAVLEEREQCAELMERQHTWLTNVAASNLIRTQRKKERTHYR